MNWAVLERGRNMALAPTFDHGSALASGVTDDVLTKTDPTKFGLRGLAARFEGGRSMTLVDLARGAIKGASPQATVWLDRLAAVTNTAVDAVLAEIPGLSVVRRTFMERLLSENRRRLLA